MNENPIFKKGDKMLPLPWQVEKEKKAAGPERRITLYCF